MHVQQRDRVDEWKTAGTTVMKSWREVPFDVVQVMMSLVGGDARCEQYCVTDVGIVDGFFCHNCDAYTCTSCVSFYDWPGNENEDEKKCFACAKKYLVDSVHGGNDTKCFHCFKVGQTSISDDECFV